MKKLILLFSLSSLVLCSCSDDESPMSNEDIMVGTWSIDQWFVNGEERTLDECEKRSLSTVKENGTITLKNFYFDETSGTCQADEIETLTWENIGDNVYRVIFDPNTPEERIFELEITFDGTGMGYFETVVGQTTYKYVYRRNL